MKRVIQSVNWRAHDRQTSELKNHYETQLHEQENQ
jgi:hypothetical protein